MKRKPLCDRAQDLDMLISDTAKSLLKLEDISIQMKKILDKEQERSGFEERILSCVMKVVADQKQEQRKIRQMSVEAREEFNKQFEQLAAQKKRGRHSDEYKEKKRILEERRDKELKEISAQYKKLKLKEFVVRDDNGEQFTVNGKDIESAFCK